MGVAGGRLALHVRLRGAIHRIENHQAVLRATVLRHRDNGNALPGQRHALPGQRRLLYGSAASLTATRDGERDAYPSLPVQTAPRCVVLPGNDALRILLPGNAASFTATRDSESDGPRQTTTH